MIGVCQPVPYDGRTGVFEPMVLSRVEKQIDPVAAEILDFWFAQAHRARWFRSTPDFDDLIRERYLTLWEQARDGRLEHWRTTPEGALALVIVLDQLPLNMFRDDAHGYSTEAMARDVAEEAIARGFDRLLDGDGKALLYLTFMHSESLADQDRAVALFGAAGLSDNLKWARHHRDIIRRFGRFPHRNAALGRDSTAEDLDYLASPGSFKG